VHVIGDSIAAAPGMPKSGHMANQQGKVCAAAVVALLKGQPVNDEPIIANTCYSFVGDRDVVHVASVHRYDPAKKTMLPVQGAGGLSPEANLAEGVMAVAWAFNILNDTFSG
jgi:NADH dehydrogenase FAD-containing subunit